MDNNAVSWDNNKGVEVMVGIKWAGFVPSLVPDFPYGKQQKNQGLTPKKRPLLTFDALPLPCSAVCQAAPTPPLLPARFQVFHFGPESPYS